MITIDKIDESYLNLSEATTSELRLIKQHFSAYQPGYRYLYTYKRGLWDGKFYLILNSMFPYGMLSDLKTFLIDNSIVFKVNFTEEPSEPISELDTELENYILHDYQIKAFIEAVENKRLCIELPTGSGKTAVIYALLKYLTRIKKKVLLVVPRTNLVLQMKSNFEEYGGINDLFIVKGKNKTSNNLIILSTWQSIYRLPHEYFQQFDAILVDEAHNSVAKELNKLINRCSNAKYKIGFSGTFAKKKTYEYLLQVSALGPIRKYTDYAKLKELKQISEFKVEVIKLTYPELEKKFVYKNFNGDYQNEVNYINANTARNNMLTKMFSLINHNTIALFSKKNTHCKVLFEEAKRVIKDKLLIYMDGESSAEERENFREIMKNNDNVIGFVTFGIFSEGISINNLHNVFLASSYKSRIKILQSIGRNLRTNENKKIGKIFDVVDDFSMEMVDPLTNTTEKFTNYSMIHMFNRVRLYKEMGIEFKVNEVKL